MYCTEYHPTYRPNEHSIHPSIHTSMHPFSFCISLPRLAKVPVSVPVFSYLVVLVYIGWLTLTLMFYARLSASIGICKYIILQNHGTICNPAYTSANMARQVDKSPAVAPPTNRQANKYIAWIKGGIFSRFGGVADESKENQYEISQPIQPRCTIYHQKSAHAQLYICISTS